MKNIFLIITSSALLITLSIIFIPYLEQSSAKFENYSDLIGSGLIEKGWVPKYIPKSATNIHEKHKLDSNIVEMDFNYDPNEIKVLLNSCKLVVKNNIGKKFICPPFEGQTSILTLRNDGVGYYSSQSDGLY